MFGKSDAALPTPAFGRPSRKREGGRRGARRGRSACGLCSSSTSVSQNRAGEGRSGPVQAKACAGRRRRMTAPIMPKPASIVAQVAGSGTLAIASE